MLLSSDFKYPLGYFSSALISKCILGTACRIYLPADLRIRSAELYFDKFIKLHHLVSTVGVMVPSTHRYLSIHLRKYLIATKHQLFLDTSKKGVVFGHPSGKAVPIDTRFEITKLQTSSSTILQSAQHDRPVFCYVQYDLFRYFRGILRQIVIAVEENSLPEAILKAATLSDKIYPYWSRRSASPHLARV